MSLGSGTYELGPEVGTLELHTFREGMGAKVGHDLVITVARWSGRATVVADEPARSSVTVVADARSLEVRDGRGGVKPLSDADRAEIKRIAQDKILAADSFPEITFRSSRVAGSTASVTVEGDLAIRGVTTPIRFELRMEDAARGKRLSGAATVAQTAFGIKPYSAFFGALKVRDAVEVAIDVTVGSA